jgi:hypothetical protein
MSDGPNETPLSDLRAMALKHYENVSMRAHHWSSDIPRAINAYYDAEEAKLAAPSPEGTPETIPPAPALSESEWEDLRFIVAAYAESATTKFAVARWSRAEDVLERLRPPHEDRPR